MEYLFVVGTHPILSVAEIFAYFKQKCSFIRLSESCFVVGTEEFDASVAIKKLGGVIKIAKIEFDLPKKDTNLFAEKAVELLADYSGKVMYGLSNYQTPIRVTDLAMSLKKKLREVGKSARWVTSKEPVLSSVVVGQNKLISEGAEFCLVMQDKQIRVARTLAIQDYKGLSSRDYGRPGRDDQSGMLPPKLAQIMLNLARVSTTSAVLDPFCGSGTVLTEAVLMGLTDITGSDISSKAVSDTKLNLEWTRERYKINFKEEVVVLDAKNLSKKFPPSRFQAVVFEGFLGPQRGAVNWPQVYQELKQLYKKSLEESYKVLKPGGFLVCALPYVNFKGSNLQVELDLSAWKYPKVIPGEIDVKTAGTKRGGLIYGRAGQKVHREILVLEK